MALPVVVSAVVLLALALTGIAIAERDRARAARGVVAGVRARAAAEGALVQAVAGGTLRRAASLAVGADTVLPVAGARVRVLRLDTLRALVEASVDERTGAVGAWGRATRRVAALLRVRPAMPTLAAALTVGGETRIGDRAEIGGADVLPSGWSGCATSGDTAAVAAPDASLVVVSGGAHVAGAVRALAIGTDALQRTRDGETWSALAARADVTLPAGAVVQPAPRAADDGTCVVTADAWGEPARGGGSAAACTGAFPVVAAAGALVLRGPARGQGTLVVGGDLVIDGDVTFAGAVLVRGRVRTERGALRVDGALVAAHAPDAPHADGWSVAGAPRPDVSVLGDGTRVRWSRCAVVSAALGAARVGPLGRRVWQDVTP